MTAIGQQLYHLSTSNLDKTVAVHVNADGSALTVTGKDLARDAQGVRPMERQEPLGLMANPA